MPIVISAAHDRVQKTRVGVVGTGFIAVGLFLVLKTTPDMIMSRMLTRRSVESVSNVDPELLTCSEQELLDNSDVIVECSGDIAHASRVINAAQERGMPVVTMGAEFHVTVGSYFSQRGWISEAEGDQPGSLAALHEEAVGMGFSPLVYGNIKGFLNHEPEQKEMEYWSRRNGISLVNVTSFTDGTKLQIEQALVANGLGADIATPGMFGPSDMPLEEGGNYLGAMAKAHGCPISDYVLSKNLPPGVFLVGEHPTERPETLRYLKLGDGPFYTLLRPYHLCHLELPRTIRRLLAGQPPLLNNTATPRATVVAIAKQDLAQGHVIETAIGGPELRGEARTISDALDSPPIGVLFGARLRHSVAKGQTLRLSDVDIPDGLVKTAWQMGSSTLTAAS